MSAPRVTQSNASGTGSQMNGDPTHDTGNSLSLASAAESRFGVVLLAGALKQSPLRQALGVPTLCLPLASDVTLLSSWLDLLERSNGCCWVKILVSSAADVLAINDAVTAWRGLKPSSLSLEVSLDKGAWRGPAGLLRDIVVDAAVEEHLPVIAAEASCLPPVSLKPLLDQLTSETQGVVGCDVRWHEPAGLYAFRAGVLSNVPSRGYYDIKEQLLPTLYEQGIAVKCAETTGVVNRIRCGESYLRAVQVMLSDPERRGISEKSMISNEARVYKGCIVQDGVSIADGAIVHRSVVLSGAKIGGGAIVANSILGCNASVEARQIVKSEIMAEVSQPSKPILVTVPGMFSRFRPRRDRKTRMAKANR